jgi:hypothetical protein
MNSNVKSYFLEAGDVTPEQGWRLLRWCHAHGATEFTLYWNDDAHLAESMQLLTPLRRANAVREHARYGTTGEVELFEFSESGIAILQRLLPHGVFSYWFWIVDAVQWVEDPVLYRDGELMLAAISHEDWAEIRLSETERAELLALGFRPSEA